MTFNIIETRRQLLQLLRAEELRRLLPCVPRYPEILCRLEALCALFHGHFE